MRTFASHLRNGPVAQLNRASDYGSEGYRFESCRDHKSHLNTEMTFFICIQNLKSDHKNHKARGSRNLMGISVELCDSKEEKLFICHSMKISSEKFDFSIE